MLRQFAGLFLVVFLAMAAWRWWHGHADAWAVGLAIAAVVIGGAGLLSPSLIKPVYMGWMIAAFPIGWTVSRLALATIYFLVVTPIAWVFRASGRDLLRLKRHPRETYWTAKSVARDSREYLRQS